MWRSELRILNLMYRGHMNVMVIYESKAFYFEPHNMEKYRKGDISWVHDNSWVPEYLSYRSSQTWKKIIFFFARNGYKKCARDTITQRRRNTNDFHSQHMKKSVSFDDFLPQIKGRSREKVFELEMRDRGGHALRPKVAMSETASSRKRVRWARRMQSILVLRPSSPARR